MITRIENKGGIVLPKHYRLAEGIRYGASQNFISILESNLLNSNGLNRDTLCILGKQAKKALTLARKKIEGILLTGGVKGNPEDPRTGLIAVLPQYDENPYAEAVVTGLYTELGVPLNAAAQKIACENGVQFFKDRTATPFGFNLEQFRGISPIEERYGRAAIILRAISAGTL